jgi:hypothetical protein
MLRRATKNEGRSAGQHKEFAHDVDHPERPDLLVLTVEQGSVYV